jgi:lipopolysaccharide/colanic/teichoic acid biosynthesis glycosyltransferase
MDAPLAGSALIVLSPLWLLVALGIRVTVGSPVFHRQVRPGYLGRVFKVIKFRSRMPELDPVAARARQMTRVVQANSTCSAGRWAG